MSSGRTPATSEFVTWCDFRPEGINPGIARGRWPVVVIEEREPSRVKAESPPPRWIPPLGSGKEGSFFGKQDREDKCGHCRLHSRSKLRICHWEKNCRLQFPTCPW